MDWPVDFLSQLLKVQELEERLNRLENESKSVYVNTKDHPTLDVWRNAYVIQTGNPLPIRPGTKLIWSRPGYTRHRAYTITPAGEIVDYVDRIRSTANLQLLGKSFDETPLQPLDTTSQTLGLQNLSEPRWGTRKTNQNNQLHGDWRTWVNTGLEGVMFFFSVKSTDSFEVSHITESFEPILNLTGTDQGSHLVYYAYTNNTTFDSVMASGRDISLDTNLTGSYLTAGYIYLNRPTLSKMTNGEFVDPVRPVRAIGRFVQHTGAAPLHSASNALRFGQLYLGSEPDDKSPATQGLFNLRMETNPHSKTWAYGVFNKAVERELQE